MRWFLAAGFGLAIVVFGVGWVSDSEDLLPTADPATKPTAAPATLVARTLADPDLNELSGLAASRLHDGVLYGINDSGAGPIVHAIGPDGSSQGRLTLAGAKAFDWEALAPGWDPDGRPTLWIGDIGDNLAQRAEITLYQITEPPTLGDQQVSWQAFKVRYPDGAHNAEALLVDPSTGSLLIVTKGDGEPGTMYAADRPTDPDQVIDLKAVGVAPDSITDGAWELAPRGAPRLVLVDYWQLHRQTPEGWESALGPLQLLREAVAWPWLGAGVPTDEVYVGSEGARTPILPATVP